MFQDYTDQHTIIAACTILLLIAGTYRMLVIDDMVISTKLRLALAVCFPAGWLLLLHAGWDELWYRVKSS